MHCSGDIASAFLNSWLMALGTFFILDYIPSLKIHTNCSRKSNWHKFQLFSADEFCESQIVIVHSTLKGFEHVAKRVSPEMEKHSESSSGFFPSV